MHIRSRVATAGAIAIVSAAAVVAASPWAAGSTNQPTTRGDRQPVIELKDARIKFEINSTDQDGGIQVFLDADPWKTMSVYDPTGRRVLTFTTAGRVARQGGTELFMESAEPEFTELPIDELLARFPAGEYRFRGRGLSGERYVGTAVLTHDLPDGPELLSPLEDQGPQNPNRTTVRWEPVDPPNGSPIIGYQVLVVQPDTGITALPKIILDVMMPPDATQMRVPPGFLQPETEYEWEVLAVESGGNQTLSSSTFTTR
jgi:fibronectin type III domain protein